MECLAVERKSTYVYGSYQKLAYGIWTNGMNELSGYNRHNSNAYTHQLKGAIAYFPRHIIGNSPNVRHLCKSKRETC